MDLIDFIKENNIKILDRWIDQVLGSYAPESRRILKQQQDQFANPIGYNVAQRLREFFIAFCDEEEPDKSAAALEPLIKIRAVQDFSPAQSVAFIFQFKEIVADEYNKAKEITFDTRQWLAFSGRVDMVALLVFDIYLACRERLYQTRINEIKSGRHILTDGDQCPSALLRAGRGKNKNGAEE
jgi:hypothetical protein